MWYIIGASMSLAEFITQFSEMADETYSNFDEDAQTVLMIEVLWQQIDPKLMAVKFGHYLVILMSLLRWLWSRNTKLHVAKH